MTSKQILGAFFMLTLAACSSVSAKKNWEDTKFSFKDDMEKFTAVVYEHQYYGNSEPSKAIVRECKIPATGITEKSFENFVQFSPSQARTCFNMLVNYKDARFNKAGSRDAGAYKEFQAKVNFYRQHYFKPQ